MVYFSNLYEIQRRVVEFERVVPYTLFRQTWFRVLGETSVLYNGQSPHLIQYLAERNLWWIYMGDNEPFLSRPPPEWLPMARGYNPMMRPRPDRRGRRRGAPAQGRSAGHGQAQIEPGEMPPHQEPQRRYLFRHRGDGGLEPGEIPRQEAPDLNMDDEILETPSSVRRPQGGGVIYAPVALRGETPPPAYVPNAQSPRRPEGDEDYEPSPDP
ncbi:hypothetical protein G7Y89_g1717 [Cudoniella acicularis]|uniref:Uncharacterized protein n=1 Tax=Cudoniella acicularis TaxID=354080 RepID=A0A8H4RWP1_9HELO|nr:hypothetical protein G7Y89_g1717 [Cudoniella acicularis]